ncbi:class 1 fructose-bisphosphatase [Halorientalis regularis]|jgi:fructose-1,6-bisphosphatase I|uniref:Fructose-1,6-bisphosphatase class 1 n=1 Tax=Halorientalis regularis TaxID=660518 RepID=A0A1G7FMC2_9EURY|nr:class 1 fructose-bisphosphatase [Halorientalis regularis]SDE77020.1 D-fructose 1,6-bisphosphatase [Halorientalis regularis]
MSEVVSAIVDVVTETAPDVRAGLTGRREYETSENPSGEQMLAADRHADELLEDRLLAIDGVASYASEEREGIVEDEESDGGLHVACDPLDGSSNLKSNNVMGTILAVYDEPLPAPGRALVAAGYVLYGPITTLVLARDDAVTEYVIDDTDEGVERRVVEEDVTIPSDPVVYGFGGRVPDWHADFEAFVREIEDELKLRYGGAMIGDVSQVMEYGGIFAYPSLESAENGKLRLQFEGNPIGYIVESAGGRSSDGERSLLDVEPDRLHQRVPVHVGNTELIERLEGALD